MHHVEIIKNGDWFFLPKGKKLQSGSTFTFSEQKYPPKENPFEFLSYFLYKCAWIFLSMGIGNVSGNTFMSIEYWVAVKFYLWENKYTSVWKSGIGTVYKMWIWSAIFFCRLQFWWEKELQGFQLSTQNLGSFYSRPFSIFVPILYQLTMKNLIL